MAQRSKIEEVIEKADQLFMRDGYRKVSMDMIAAHVPVSKPTLYNHFRGKDELFSAVVGRRCKILLSKIAATMDKDADVETALRNIAAAFLDLVLSPEALKTHRIIIAECTDFPEMAKLFYESGPKQAYILLSRYLTYQHEKKILNVPNPELSAGMFLSMLKGQDHMQFLLGLKKKISPIEISKVIDYAVRLFVKAHS